MNGLRAPVEISVDLSAIAAKLDLLQQTQEIIMAKLDDIIADETQETTVVGQLATAVKALQDNVASLTQQIKDLLAGVTLPPTVQAQVDQAFAASDANLKSVQAILDSLASPPPA